MAKYRIIAEGIGHHHLFKVQKRLAGFLWWVDVVEPTLKGEDAPVIFHKQSEAIAFVEERNRKVKVIKP